MVCLPSSADDTMMAAIPTQGLTAWLMLNASTQLRPGESVLVHGAGGGVGSLAVQIAKSMGAGFVSHPPAAKRSSPLPEASAQTKPSTTTCRLAKSRSRSHWWPRSRHRPGVDRRGDLRTKLRVPCHLGRYIIFGSTRGPGKPFEPRRLMSKCQSMTGIYLPVFNAKPELVRQGMQYLVDQAVHGKLRAQVSAILPLSQTAEAHRLLEERQVVGAVVLDPRT